MKLTEKSEGNTIEINCDMHLAHIQFKRYYLLYHFSFNWRPSKLI